MPAASCTLANSGSRVRRFIFHSAAKPQPEERLLLRNRLKTATFSFYPRSNHEGFSTAFFPARPGRFVWFRSLALPRQQTSLVLPRWCDELFRAAPHFAQGLSRL